VRLTPIQELRREVSSARTDLNDLMILAGAFEVCRKYECCQSLYTGLDRAKEHLNESLQVFFGKLHEVTK